MSKLHVDSVIKNYDYKTILRNIFLTCETGEIIGLLGSNGSGKSTLLKIIFGIVPSENKFVRVDDKVILKLFDTRNLIKYLPQEGFLLKNIKVKYIVKLFCGIRNSKNVLGVELISSLINQKCKDLSGGEKRFLEIVMILNTTSKIILLDEPFNGISPIYREKIKEILKEKSKTKGIIITDHDYLNIMDVSTRLELLHEGSLTKIENKEELIKWEYLRR